MMTKDPRREQIARRIVKDFYPTMSQEEFDQGVDYGFNVTIHGSIMAIIDALRTEARLAEQTAYARCFDALGYDLRYGPRIETDHGDICPFCDSKAAHAPACFYLVLEAAKREVTQP